MCDVRCAMCASGSKYLSKAAAADEAVAVAAYGNHMAKCQRKTNTVTDKKNIHGMHTYMAWIFSKEFALSISNLYGFFFSYFEWAWYVS